MALFSHSVRSHSSTTLLVKTAFWGGLDHVVVCPGFIQRGYPVDWLVGGVAVP